MGLCSVSSKQVNFSQTPHDGNPGLSFFEEQREHKESKEVEKQAYQTAPAAGASKKDPLELTLLQKARSRLVSDATRPLKSHGRAVAGMDGCGRREAASRESRRGSHCVQFLWPLVCVLAADACGNVRALGLSPAAIGCIIRLLEH